jgi:hypothetical protein
MKVLKVIVDEMPETCFDCSLSSAKDNRHQHWCSITGMQVWMSECPSWCPLEVETDGWFAVSERLPDDGVEVLGYFEHGDYWTWDIVAYYCDPNVWTADDRVLRNGAVTHWRYLPEAPKEVKE